MSLSVIQPPPALIFSADQTEVKFLAIDAVEVGAKAVNRLNVSPNIEPGINFIFYYGSIPLVMTSAAVPDISGTQFLAGSGAPVAAADLLVYFRANTRLNADFEISVIGSDLLFTAKENGAQFNCANTADVTNTVVGKTALTKNNYTVFFKLFLENADNTGFDLIYKTNLQLLPGSSTANAPIGDKLHVAISKDIRQNLPERPISDPLQCKNSCRKYYYEFAESFGSPAEPQTSTTSEIYTVIHGGLSTIGKFRNTCLELLAPAEPDNDRFLRQGPTEFYTRVNQPQYLFFCNTRETKSVDLVFDFKYFDGEETHTEIIAGISMEEMRKYAFNTRFDQIFNTEGVLVQSYDVYLSLGGSRVSEIITYHLDYTLNYHVRYFLNWSSLGAMDSRATKGKGEPQIEWTNKTANRFPNPGENIQYGHSFTYDSRLSRSFQVASGWLTRKELHGYADFFLSDLKYRFSNDMLLPIYTAPDKAIEDPDGSNLFSRLFTYSYHFQDHVYTDGDAEDEGMSIGIFGYNLGLGGSGLEIDPTVPSHVKGITQSDIDRWNANSRGEVVPAPASAQTAGIFTIPWDAAKKAKYGPYGRFIVEMESSYEISPIQISKDSDGKPNAYIFTLSGINSLIHII